jgi:hypothetical protein
LKAEREIRRGLSLAKAKVTNCVLGLEHGVTFSTGGDAFTLNNAIAGQIKDAQVQGTQLVLRSILSYTAASRSVGAGIRAFEDATKFLVGNMLRSVARKLEGELFYGQVGYGIIGTVTGTTFAIVTSEWAPGLWVGAENMPIDIYSSNLAVYRGSANVVSISMINQTITVDNAPAGTVATDVIYVYGAQGNEFAGLHAILTNTGTLFNINATSYALWQASQYSAGSAPLSFSKISAAVARAVEKGLDSEVMCMVNPRAWSDLLSDQAALRRYDSSFKTSELQNGAEGIRFFSQNGVVEIVPSIFVKQGYAYIIPLDEMLRIGSTDITFRRPGQGDEFFRDLETAAGYELRAFTDQALFCSAPGKAVLINNIVNAS